MPEITVPLFSATGKKLPVEMPLEFIERYVNHFTVVRNRRGHIKRAYVKRILAFDDRPSSLLGIAFRQELWAGGFVWALSGVEGSS